MDVGNKNVLIIGFGKTGKGACHLLENKTSSIFIYDEKTHKEFNEDIKYDLAVLSPGVDFSIFKHKNKLIQDKTQIISELDLASLFCKANVIGITGTNGKTTTTLLVSHILNCSNIKSMPVGNIGETFSEHCEKDVKFFVCECSSFQLEQSKFFSPKIKMFLNFSSDHISRHKTLENYFQAKLNLFGHLHKDDILIFNYDLSKKIPENIKKSPNLYYFSSKHKVKGAYLKNNLVIYNDGEKEEVICKTSDVKLRGDKNMENALAAVVACLHCGVSQKTISKALSSFQQARHRLEVFSARNRTFVNDSKATNISSTLLAISAFSNKPLILLLGGCDKNQDFSNFFRQIPNTISKVVCFGKDGEKIYKALKDKVKCKLYLEKTLKEATIFAMKNSDEQDVVLLSPACASYDEFSNYEERGDFFCDLVKNFKTEI